MFDDIISRYKKIFKEEDWFLRVLIGGIVVALSFAVIGLPLFLGYLMNLIEKRKKKKDLALPKWQNIEKLFMDGLPVAIFLVVISFIISIFNMIMSSLGCVGIPLSILLNLAYGLIMPVVIIIGIIRMKELLNWKEAFVIGAFMDDLKKNFMCYLPTLLSIALLSFLSVVLGLMTCGILLPFLVFITIVALYPLLADIYIEKNSPHNSQPKDKKEEVSSASDSKDQTIKMEVNDEIVEEKTIKDKTIKMEVEEEVKPEEKKGE